MGTLYKDVNFENLQRAYNYLLANANFISEHFDIGIWREDMTTATPICGSTGCLIGHLLGAFTEQELVNLELISMTDLGGHSINYWDVPEKLFNMPTDGDNDKIADYLFSSGWEDIDGSFEGAMSRFRTVLAKQDYRRTQEYQKFEEYFWEND